MYRYGKHNYCEQYVLVVPRELVHVPPALGGLGAEDVLARVGFAQVHSLTLDALGPW